MTFFEAIGVLKGNFLNVDMRDKSHAEVYQEAFDKAIDALIELDQIESHGCVVCKMSKEYDCNGCAYDGTEDWKEPCRICRRNHKDYYSEAANEGCNKSDM